MRVAILVMLCIIAMLIAWTTLRAEAISYTVEANAPLSVIIESPCGESAALTGSLHGTMHYTQTPKGAITLVTVVGPSTDARATGLDSGQQYQVTGHTTTKLTFEQGIVESVRYQHALSIVGLYRVRYTYHLMLAEDGTMSVQVENLKGMCQ